MIRTCCTGLFALIAVAVAGVTPASAQLRPLQPLAWEVFDAGRSTSGWVGMGVHREQRASLAGTEGRLAEAGNFQGTWRSGRVAVEAAGTVYRFLRDEERFAPAFGGALDEEGPDRSDSGDYRLLTTVLLTPPDRHGPAAALRFGTRLPTTNNRVGLDRDQTDFFGLVAGRAPLGPLRLAAETGVGIYGTRYADFEQSDLWIYAASAELPAGALTASAALLGQMDLSAGEPLRGNEDLAELRAGLRLGRARWLQAQLVRGLTPFSPSLGVLLSAGVTR